MPAMPSSLASSSPSSQRKGPPMHLSVLEVAWHHPPSEARKGLNQLPMPCNNNKSHVAMQQ